MPIRGFQKTQKYLNNDFTMPSRQTTNAAGYDFYLPEEVVLEPGKLVMVPTGIKAYMQADEYLGIHIRSSMAVKKQLCLVNNEGIIDSDYYNNPDNEGHIMLPLINRGKEKVVLPKNERIAQGIFYKFLTADDDTAVEKNKRSGGFGSTN